MSSDAKDPHHDDKSSTNEEETAEEEQKRLKRAWFDHYDQYAKDLTGDSQWTKFVQMPGGQALLLLQWHIEKHGLDVNEQSAVHSPLVRASRDGLADCVKYLIEQKADLEGMSDCGCTAVQETVIELGKFDTSVIGHQRCLRLLLDAKADPDAHSPERSTPLMYCAEYGLDQTARMLLKAGAKLDIRARYRLTFEGRQCGAETALMTALEVARQECRPCMIELLNGVRDFDWSPESHKHFPAQDKVAVVALLILHRTQLSSAGKGKIKRLKSYHPDPKNRFWKLPRPLLLRIFALAFPKARFVPPES